MALALCLCGCNSKGIHTEFISDVCIKPFRGYKYHTCVPLDFTVNGNKFTVPKGFATDLASIPRIAWPIIAPSHASIIKPAIVHDWFYRETCDFNRKNTDLIFYHMLINEGVSPIISSAMYYAVRLFGAKFYNEDYCE